MSQAIVVVDEATIFNKTSDDQISVIMATAAAVVSIRVAQEITRRTWNMMPLPTSATVIKSKD